GKTEVTKDSLFNAARFRAPECQRRHPLELSAETVNSRAMQSSVQSLAGLPLFSGLSEADFETFLQLFEQRELTKGTTLFKAGVAAEFMYFLMKGSVSLQRGTEEVLVAQSPAPLGELAAMTGEDRNLTAIAASEIVVL